MQGDHTRAARRAVGTTTPRHRRRASLAALVLVPLGLAATAVPASAAVVVQRGLDGGILLLDPAAPATAEPKLLAFGRCPVLTPDAQTVVFVGPDDRSLLAAPTSGGETRLLSAGVSAGKGCEDEPVVSPDGSTVAGRTSSGRIITVRLSDGRRTKVGTKSVSPIALVPGGKSILIDRNAKGGGIDILSATNKKKPRLRRLTKDHVSYAPTWAYKWVIYSRVEKGRTTLRRLTPKNGKSKRLLRRPKNWLVTGTGIGPNGSRVLVVTQRVRAKDFEPRGPISIGSMHPRTGKTRWLPALGTGEQPLGGTDQGTGALVIDGGGQLFRIDLATGERTLLTTGVVAAAGA
ncbi:MAG: TolB family protein [Solirubrobacteraceae bacterium]